MVFVAVGDRLAGLIGVADPVKATTPEAVRQLRAEGLDLVMVTGDNPVTAEAVAARLGIPRCGRAALSVPRPPHQPRVLPPPAPWNGSESRRAGRSALTDSRDPVGQLAVDTGCPADLLSDAAKRALAAADVIGARALVVQALDDGTKRFCERFGFRSFSSREPLMLVLRISDLRAAL